MFVLFDRNTLTPIEFSHNQTLLYETARDLEDCFGGGCYGVLDEDTYNTLYYTNQCY